MGNIISNYVADEYLGMGLGYAQANDVAGLHGRRGGCIPDDDPVSSVASRPARGVELRRHIRGAFGRDRDERRV